MSTNTNFLILQLQAKWSASKKSNIIKEKFKYATKYFPSKSFEEMMDQQIIPECSIRRIQSGVMTARTTLFLDFGGFLAGILKKSYPY
jgi:hypothetical protein